MSGKGDKRRPEDSDAYASGYDRIFGVKDGAAKGEDLSEHPAQLVDADSPSQGNHAVHHDQP